MARQNSCQILRVEFRFLVEHSHALLVFWPPCLNSDCNQMLGPEDACWHIAIKSFPRFRHCLFEEPVKCGQELHGNTLNIDRLSFCLVSSLG